MKPAVENCVNNLKSTISSEYNRVLSVIDGHAQKNNNDQVISIIDQYNNGQRAITVYRPRKTRVSTMNDAVDYLKQNLPENVTAIDRVTRWQTNGNPDTAIYVSVRVPDAKSFVTPEAAIRKAESVLMLRDQHATQLNSRFDYYDQMKTQVNAVCDACVNLTLFMRANGNIGRENRMKITTLSSQLRRDITYINLNSNNEDLAYLNSSAYDLQNSLYRCRTVDAQGNDEYINIINTILKNISEALDTISIYRSTTKAVLNAWDKIHAAMDEADEFETRIRKEFGIESGAVCFS